MDRCPNCGSSVRIGAKFCTTCGFRLPAEAPAPAPVTPSRSPFDTTSTSSVSSRWPVPEAAPPPPVVPLPVPAPVEADQAVETAAVPVTAELVAAPDAATPDEPATFTGWPAYGTGFGPRTAWDGKQEDAAAVPPADDTAGVDDVQSVEAAIHAWSDDNGTYSSNGTIPDVPDSARAADNEGEAAAEPDTLDWFTSIAPENEAVEVEAPVAQENAHTDEYKAFLDLIEQDQDTSSVSESEIAEAPVPTEAIAETPGEIGIQPASDDALVATGAEIADDVDVLASAPPVAEAAPAETGSTGGQDAAERAAALLDELKSLLPLLRAGGPQTVPEVGAIADELAATRTLSEEDASSLKSLRAAIATAQARPRDVDVMLDLVTRAGAIGELISAHDRYAAAIDTAIAKLRGNHQLAPEPRW